MLEMTPTQQNEEKASRPVPNLELKQGHEPITVQSLQYTRCLKFHFDDIDDPVFGVATGLRGEIPILHSVKQFRGRIELLKAKPQVLEDLVWGMVKKYRDAWADMTDEEIYDRLKISAQPIFVLLGDSLDHNTAIRDFTVEFFTIFNELDGEVDDVVGQKELSGVPSEFNMMTIFDAFQPARMPRLEDVPSGLQKVDKFRGIFQRILDQLMTLIPDYTDEEYGERLGPELHNVVKIYLGLYELEMEKKNVQFSPETMNEIMGLIGGYYLMASFLLTAHRVRLSARVRGSMLMDISWWRAGDILALINGIIGLHRDVRLNQLDSPITCAVRYGVPLQSAWDAAMRRLHALYKDYRMANEKMKEAFTDEMDAASIRKYVEVMDTFIDGIVFAYSLTDRYGNKHQMRIVE